MGPLSCAPGLGLVVATEPGTHSILRTLHPSRWYPEPPPPAAVGSRSREQHPLSPLLETFSHQEEPQPFGQPLW